ncbi:hypothetical protein [Streptomyces apocyni]|uniref:hypothetical protein n=1 Tax=Streptomyces apocyni TaxID=2654677 RepID=UPI0012E9B152|nr:hypothetical protein [Streptomyces apocyni]
MNMQEAAEQADVILDNTLNTIKPGVQWAHGITSAGHESISRDRTVMTIISDERRGAFLGIVERFWKESGYTIKSVNSSERTPAIFAQSPDGFGISLIIGGKGQAYFVVDSPCVQKSDVADPTTPPSYQGEYPLPRPNVHSDFWSANTPLPPNP